MKTSPVTLYVSLLVKRVFCPSISYRIAISDVVGVIVVSTPAPGDLLGTLASGSLTPPQCPLRGLRAIPLAMKTSPVTLYGSLLVKRVFFHSISYRIATSRDGLIARSTSLTSEPGVRRSIFRMDCMACVFWPFTYELIRKIVRNRLVYRHLFATDWLTGEIHGMFRHSPSCPCIHFPKSGSVRPNSFTFLELRAALFLVMTLILVYFFAGP